MGDIPEIVRDDEKDDFQTSNLNIIDLVNKFIVPIERVRSIAAPAIFNMAQTRDEDDRLSKTMQDTAQIDIESPQESRCHAFYRMIGFPVVSEDYSFYSPGFNHKRTQQARERDARVDSNISNVSNLMAQFRESSARNRYLTFKKHGAENSVYTSVLPVIKQFNLSKEGAAWDEQDNQQFTLSDRKLFSYLYVKSDDSEIGNFFETGTHILRPFVVNPSIAKTTMPASNIICAPFLETEEDTKLDDTVKLLRPGIELILRMRLTDMIDDELFKRIIFTLEYQDDIAGYSSSQLKSLAEALLNDNKITANLYLSNMELKNINELVKQIKFLINHLFDSMDTLRDVLVNINWTPISNTSGPEFGCEVGNYIKYTRNISKLEQRIKELSILKNLQSQPQGIDVTAFALSSLDDTRNSYDQELSESLSQRDDYIEAGSNAIRDIEYIVGEISGLGLIDILSIYMALWAVDIEVLISMLDDSAFSRLYNGNKELRTAAVVNRFNSGPSHSIYEAIEIFDSQVFSILSYVDKLVSMRRTNSFRDMGSIK